MTATSFIDGGPRKPRHMISYSAPGKWVSRTVRRDPSTGRPLVICEADDITTCRIDLSHILERGDAIASAQDSATHCRTGLTYDGPFLFLTISNPSCDGLLLLNIRTTLNEQFTLRIGTRLPHKHGEPRSVTGKSYARGGIDNAPASEPPAPATTADEFDVVWGGVDW